MPRGILGELLGKCPKCGAPGPNILCPKCSSENNNYHFNSVIPDYKINTFKPTIDNLIPKPTLPVIPNFKVNNFEPKIDNVFPNCQDKVPHYLKCEQIANSTYDYRVRREAKLGIIPLGSQQCSRCGEWYFERHICVTRFPSRDISDCGRLDRE